MSFFKAGTAVLVFFVVTFNSSCIGASLNTKQSDEIDSLYVFRTGDDTLLLTWNLLEPTEAVRGYRVNWNDGTGDKHVHVSVTEATIPYPSNLHCNDELVVTVTALDAHNITIGEDYPKKIALQDIVTNVTLTPKEDMISASWSIACPSGGVSDIVVIWEEVEHRHELSCDFAGTARDTAEPASCTASEQVLKPCKSYYVFIEPVDSSSNFVGIAWKMLSYTLEEGPGSKLVEMIELEEAKSRSATLLWKGPNPECPGTNYALTYTETRLGSGQTTREQVKVVEKESKWSNRNTDGAISANLHPTRIGKVMGHVDNLQPYSVYEFCVTAGNSMTNLVCKAVRTPEEKPKKPTHLSLQNEQPSPTTIDVTWKEPPNMNGKLVNYIVRWYRNSKQVGSHTTTQLSYAIVDAEPCVDYTIAVAAVNGAGEGEAAETIGALEGADCPKSDYNTDSTGALEVDVEGKAGTKKETADDALTQEDSPTKMWLMIGTICAIAGFVLCLLLIVMIKFFRKNNNGLRRKESTDDTETESLQKPPSNRVLGQSETSTSSLYSL